MSMPTISPASLAALLPGASSENSLQNSQIMSPSNQAAPTLSSEPDTPPATSERRLDPWYFAGHPQDTSTAGGPPDAPASPFLDDVESYTVDSILEDAANAYIYKKKTEFGGPTDPNTLRRELIFETRQAFLFFNALFPKNLRLPVPSSLRPIQIALLILAFVHIYNIECGAEGQPPILSVYASDGEDAGTYQTGEKVIRNLVRRFNSTLSPSEIKTTIQILEERADVRPRCMDIRIAVNNGIFNYLTKKLQPFPPELIFLTKSRVNYIENPPNPVIIMPDGVPWDVESWMAGLSDDPEVIRLLWEVVGAVIRPGVDWGKCIIPYDPAGCNGKSTFNALLRALCGKGMCASIPISEFGERFQLEPLINAIAVIHDENPSHGYLDDASAFKACISHDSVNIDRKNRLPISFRFMGLMVQECNSLPKVRDTTGSLYRRLLFVPFTKCFLGKERPYIKDDYLKRPEVLEYVLHKVLHMNYDKLSEPAASRKLLDSYKKYNSSIQEFWSEFRDQFVWTMLPWGFLYDLYVAWSKKTNPSGKPQSRTSFKADMREIIRADPDWMVSTKPDGTDAQVRPGKHIKHSEPLIGEYRLYDWQTSNTLPNFPYLKLHYTGLVRQSVQSSGGQTPAGRAD